ncbi:uncharacterized protein DNG_10127 [Cephalotrichum gorgonifer]|uniref:Uncharacterized protein n=1 Tax=Cephalotrichum gorgonifer TaxID=2041049 RepID=A0AAE8N8N0_9PEZI|nr:uncharacterized protein DNG_10127 [Cephalotrichum gorgonifer]
MAEVTIGQVAGIIAAVFVLVQIIAPLVITYILAGTLRDTESASTWTLVNQKLHAALWPTLLRVDNSQKPGVRVIINILTKALPLVALLGSIAGVITPLGLGETLDELAATTGEFEYAKDPSAFALGTSPRGVVDFTRKCTQGIGLLGGPVGCPYTGDVVTVTEFRNGSTNYNWPGTLHNDIPKTLRDIFSSGTAGSKSTISNFFDIEWRQLSTASDKFYNDEQTYGVGKFRQLDSMILDNIYRVVEGLVIDAKSGGIGFRNHTIPVGFERGATWQEDLLFIEPEAACVNTNLTFDFSIRHNNTAFSSTDIADLRLVDRGGFVNMDHEYPQYDRPNAQSNPDLWRRAYKAAFLHNGQAMFVLNVTNPNNATTGVRSFSYMNSELGKEFRLPAGISDKYETLSLTTDFGGYLHLSSFDDDLFEGDIPKHPNPFNITDKDFGDINVICSGAGNADPANVTNIYATCGLLRGAPQRTDGGPRSLQEDGSQWSSPLHVCATAVKALVKTVTFTVNGTDLAGLHVDAIEDKKYDSEADMPLWGFEETGLNVGAVDPIWGLISDEYEKHDNVSALRQPQIYLPGYAPANLPPSLSATMGSNIPGSDFASLTMNTVFGLSGNEWPFDLLGAASMAIFTRWQNLSSTPEKATDIINLLWTDLAASAVVGTKGVLGSFNDGAEAAEVKVRPIGHRITYNLLYGIPAFILGLVLLLLLAQMLFAMCFGQASMARLRLRYQQLSPGRIFTTVIFPQYSSLTMRRQEWEPANGGMKIKLGSFVEALSAPTTEKYASDAIPLTPGNGHGPLLGAAAGAAAGAVARLDG